MHEITPQEQEQLLTLMRRHRKRLMAYPNVRAVDVGFAFKQQRPSDRLAIRVHVNRKLPTSDLADAERLPEEIDGLPVDVIESNPVPDAEFRHSRQDPVLGGISIGNVKVGGPGTLGSIVFERGTLRPLALTNWHVVVASPPVAMDPIVQPQPVPPDPEPPNSFLGRLLRWDEGLDAALCSIGEQDGTRSRSVSTRIADLPLPAAGSKPHTIGLRVVKSGLRTGVTNGIIDGTDGLEFSVVVDNGLPPPQGVLGGPGDSGSLWLDRDTFTAVGLHFASITDPEVRAWGHSISAICDKLNVFVLNDVAIGTPWIGGHCRVLAQTRANAVCNLRVVYPSGRTSRASGLGQALADAQGLVRWQWRIGTSTGRRPGMKLNAFVTLDGTEHLVTTELEGTPDVTQ
ncbi:S1 family peptidase [Micromonospora peucetia]|uniref:S1 family peptidase n=1 Tax=Micromonospora peucetia TaxID=47871 RepID=A0ABZ1EKE7_9ACTN|nr:hypothetical protein [Micromonospora peucetia]MCX4387385.1 S1 family peptidase [Micromonospora peucetia]WSA34716.1 S1 family peptidase [Micromonospora peucetia]